MSEENVEVVRALFEAWNPRDSDAVREMLDPDVIVQTVGDWPEPGPYVGREAVMRFFEQLRDPWDADTLEETSDPLHAGRPSRRQGMSGVAWATALRRIWKRRSSSASARAKSAALSTSGITRKPSKPPDCGSSRCRRRTSRSSG
jgi:SnoaL-like domain